MIFTESPFARLLASSEDKVDYSATHDVRSRGEASTRREQHFIVLSSPCDYSRDIE